MVKEIEKVLRVGKELAEHIVNLSFDDLPSAVVHQSKRAILDSIATMYLGTRKEEAKGFLGFLREIKAPEECTVVGTDLKTSSIWAAFANASYAQVHDCNDGHREAAAYGGSAHPGRVAIPTALSVGEKHSASGKDVITAVVVGYDVAAKLRGMKDSPPASAYCSAATASKLMGLNVKETLFAMGIAGYHSPKNFPQTRSLDTNFLSNGYQAKVGVEAAMLAKEGFSGPALGDDNRLSLRFSERGLGKEFEIMNIYIKPYPTCRMTHGAIDAVLELKKETELNPENVDGVTVNQLTHGMYIIEDEVSTDSYYKTCQFNLPYVVACAISDGTVGEEHFTKERITDSKIHEIADKIKVVSDESLDAIYPEECRPTTVEIRTTNGETYTKSIDYPLGDPRNPLSDEELFIKMKRWVNPSVSETHAEKIRDTIFKLDRLGKITEFTKLLQ